MQDNEETIERVLESAARVASEIVVVDGGSTDGTARLAMMRDKVRLYRRPFDGNLASQKNFGCDQSHCDWILIMDSDELLSEEAVDVIPKLVADRRNRWYKFPRRWVVQKGDQSFYLKSPLHYPDYQLRLFRNEEPFRYSALSPIHHSFPREGRGRGRRLKQAWIDHFDLVLRDRSSREGKVERYNRLHPGSDQVNSIYLWEDHHVELVPFDRPGLGQGAQGRLRSS